jgi:hypothetical protein
MKRELKTVADFAASQPFGEGSVRWWIFQAKENGLERAGAIVRIGRRVYIDVNAFDAWLVANNPSLQSKAGAA